MRGDHPQETQSGHLSGSRNAGPEACAARGNAEEGHRTCYLAEWREVNCREAAMRTAAQSEERGRGVGGEASGGPTATQGPRRKHFPAARSHNAPLRAS
ncbi:hypothetical protein E2C01_009970 [Portunus trituberculatus]|uniref:Uncharacterized protein n=1 Tax=Portunus trituberculatus TaxID=210409 RepID=A0A5B7D749_PORTR|nr:hypothetical protein [Portunus trituberculatus]